MRENVDGTSGVEEIVGGGVDAVQAVRVVVVVVGA